MSFYNYYTIINIKCVYKSEKKYKTKAATEYKRHLQKLIQEETTHPNSHSSNSMVTSHPSPTTNTSHMDLLSNDLETGN